MKIMNLSRICFSLFIVIMSGNVFGHSIILLPKQAVEGIFNDISSVQHEDNLCLVVNTNQIMFSPTGSTYSICVNSNVEWTVSVAGGDWMTVTPTTGVNDGEVKVTTTDNSGSPSSRTATITISGGGMTQVIKVTQEGYGDGYLSVSKTEMKFNPTAYSQTFNISSNVSWNINVEGGNGWLNVTPMNKEVSDNDETEVTVTTDENSGNLSPRTATITISGGGMTKVIKVTQEGYGYLTVSTTHIMFNNVAYTCTFHVASNVDWDININYLEGGYEWLSVSPMHKTVFGNDVTEVKVSVTDNPEGLYRRADIIVSGGGMEQNIIISQEGIKDPPDNITVPLIEMPATATYSVSGIRIKRLQKGINIILLENGKAVKVAKK